MKMAGVLVFFLATSGHAIRERAQTLDGHWHATCHAGKIAEMRIDQSTSYLREAFYKEAHCQVPLFFLETYGLVQYPPNQVRPTDNFVLVDYTYRDIYLTPLTEEMAQQFNLGRLCGLNDWSVLIPQSISGLSCRLVDGAQPIVVPAPQQQRFGIFKVVEPWLYFGQNNQLEDSSSPARRPKDLQPEPFGKRR